MNEADTAGTLRQVRHAANHWVKYYGRENYAPNLQLAVDLAGQIELLRDLLTELVGKDPCSFNRNRSCLAHGHFRLDQGAMCPVEEAKLWLRSLGDPVDEETVALDREFLRTRAARLHPAPGAVDTWMASPHPDLGGYSPEALVALGRTSEVLAALEECGRQA